MNGVAFGFRVWFGFRVLGFGFRVWFRAAYESSKGFFCGNRKLFSGSYGLMVQGLITY